MIRCSCPEAHRDHEFTSGERWGLCRICSHTLGAHRPTTGEINARITRLLSLYNVADFTVTSTDGGKRLSLEIELVTP